VAFVVVACAMDAPLFRTTVRSCAETPHGSRCR
jgi:hypothetical protein